MVQDVSNAASQSKAAIKLSEETAKLTGRVFDERVVRAR